MWKEICLMLAKLQSLHNLRVSFAWILDFMELDLFGRLLAIPEGGVPNLEIDVPDGALVINRWDPPRASCTLKVKSFDFMPYTVTVNAVLFGSKFGRCGRVPSPRDTVLLRTGGRR
jgi:hypothetical protein